MSEWTVDTLKEYVEQRFTDQERAVNAALQAVQNAKGGTDQTIGYVIGAAGLLIAAVAVVVAVVLH